MSQADENSEVAQASSEQLKRAFGKVLQLFNKTVADEVLYTDIAGEGGKISTLSLIKLAKKVGLVAEVRKINILDIKTGPCVLVMSDGRFVVVKDDETVFYPQTNEEKPFAPKELSSEYTGYAVFFSEEQLNISSFIKRTGFLFGSVKNFKAILIEMFALAVFINIFAVLSPLFTMNIYDRVIPNFAVSTLFVLAFGMIVVYIFDLIFKIIRGYLVDYISLNIGNEVDQVLLEKLIKIKSPGIPMSQGAKNSLFRELSMVREFYFSRFIPALMDLPFVLLFLGILMLISPIVMLVPLIAGIIVFVVNVFLQVPLQSSHNKMIANEQQRNTVLVESINGIESIKIFNAVGKVLYKWKHALDISYRSAFSYNLWVNTSASFSVFIMNVVSILVMVVGVFEIFNNVMTTGGLIASATLASRVMVTIMAFSGMIVRYRSIQNTLRHLEKIVSYPSEDETSNYGKKPKINGTIQFKDVTFFYPGLKRPILNKCSFKIESKSKVAIIGKTGAGKSTVTRLLLGLDFQNGGEILMDKLDIRGIHINELRNNIGFMPQKSFFFQGTIRDNIVMHNFDISEDHYNRACELAGVNLITELSAKGDDMIVQEGGANLSGGQQQIIGFARAIINDPPIIIMDEPTNGMDTSLEAVFMKNVRSYVSDKTFILITHKPSQLSLVDRVILIDNANVVIDDTKEKVLEVLSKNSSKK